MCAETVVSHIAITMAKDKQKPKAFYSAFGLINNFLTNVLPRTGYRHLPELL